MNNLLEAFGPWAELWSASLWRATWYAAVLIPLAWLLTRYGTWLSPRVACWTWRLVCLKLLVVLIWVEPIAIPLLPARTFETTAVANVPTEANVEQSDGLTIPAQQHDTSASLPLASCAILLVWALGASYCLVQSGMQWCWARNLRRASSEITDGRISALLREEAVRLSIVRLPDIRRSESVGGPLLAGMWQPTIILPGGVDRQFETSELRLMLAHELAHLGRRDLAWNWLPSLLGAVLFFHPLLWLLGRMWSESQEAACDELVLQSGVTRTSEYGSLLLKLSTVVSREPRAVLATAGVLGNYRNLERRILAMTRVKQTSVRQLMVAGGVLGLAAILGMVPWRLVAQEVDPAVARQQAVNQLKLIGLGMHNFRDVNKRFPAASINDADGKPLLSWRVAILPYLEDQNAKRVYEEFHLDEPWDSPHNKPLVAKMPKIFACPGSKKADEGKTVYLGPRGDATIFPGSEGVRIRDITDGTSNTIFVVEADEDHAVPWTKPDDLEFDSEKPRRGLGGHFEGGRFLTLFVDGSVHALRDDIDTDLLRALFTRNGGEVVDRKRLK